MSCNYADGLSPYHDKGQLGLDEKFDNRSVVNAKVSLLSKWMSEAKHVVIHTGAGISTSAGIPDFRGPRGVWTLQAKGQKPDLSKDFNEAIPTPTHMAITKLVERGRVKYVVSQNIDGLHLRSNLPRKFLSELHGNMFTEQCNTCHRQFVRNSAVPTVGQKSLGKACPTIKPNGRHCRGRLHDTILDWEHNLPENDLGMADFHSCLSDLSICLGTTMQIVPSGNLPLYTKKHGGKLVIVNLQPTKHDRKADLIIHSYVDEVMILLMQLLKLKTPKYNLKNDPTKSLTWTPDRYFEWTISDSAVSQMRKIYEEKCGTKEARKRLNMIDDDDEELPQRITKSLRRSKGKVSEDEDDDLEIVEEIVKPKKKESPKKSKKRTTSPDYSQSASKKNSSKRPKYETEKIVIKKNVTPTKTKYEIVQPREKRRAKCEIVYATDNVCNDLEMICESGSEDEQSTFRCNFKRYLSDDKTFKAENSEVDAKKEESTSDVKDEKPQEQDQTSNETTKKEEDIKDENGEVKTEVADKKLIALDDDKKDDSKDVVKESDIEKNNDAENNSPVIVKSQDTLSKEPVEGDENNIIDNTEDKEEKEKNSTAEDKEMDDVVAEKEMVDVVAEKEMDNVFAEKEMDDVVAGKEMDDVVAEKEMDDVVAEKEMDDVVAEKEMDDVVAEKEMDDVVAEKEMDDAVAEIAKNDTTAEKDKEEISVESELRNASLKEKAFEVEIREGTANIAKESTDETPVDISMGDGDDNGSEKAEVIEDLNDQEKNEIEEKTDVLSSEKVSETEDAMEIGVQDLEKEINTGEEQKKIGNNELPISEKINAITSIEQDASSVLEQLLE